MTQLHRTIESFVRDRLGPDENFASLVAIFGGPVGLSEAEFHELFWTRLQQLHDIDARHHRWAAGVSRDPQSSSFSFSLVEHPFFLVAMHPGASRVARRFRLPAIAFNSHDQFARLRATGKYLGLRDRIRDRELAIQGTLNHNLADFGDQSDARQYSGLPLDDAWRCPFVAGPDRAGEAEPDGQ